MARPMASRPKELAKDAPYMDAFYALNASRANGMGGAEPIPISEVLAYLQLVGIASISARAKYLRLIQKLDATYLKHHAEKSAQHTP